MVRGLLCRLGAWSAAVWSASALGKADASRSDAQALPAPRPVLELVRQALQPVLDELAQRHNMSFSFGFANSAGTLGLASGVDNIWDGQRLTPASLIPLGSVTKPWTAVAIMQAVESGRLSLEDPAAAWIDPVLERLWGGIIRSEGMQPSLEGLWGPSASQVRIVDLLGMTSGFNDYDDALLQNRTLHNGGDDMGPFVYLRSAAQRGMACQPRACVTYSGSNYVLLGLVLVKLSGVYSWQDMDQLSVLSPAMREAGRYAHTSFAKLGRCLQYPGFAHQYAAYEDPRQVTPKTVYQDLFYDSCLNGWTMGNIATTGEDLASFFYDLFALAHRGTGFVNETSLKRMMEFKNLDDGWCPAPAGGKCQYGLGLMRDQLGQDVFNLLDKGTEEDIRLDGHPGEDWGSGCSPCGYNAKYQFGICVAYTSLLGMNCSADFRANLQAVDEATCRLYDAVLSIVGGPRLACAAPPPLPILAVPCEFAKAAPAEAVRHGRREMRRIRKELLQTEGHVVLPAKARDAAAAASMASVASPATLQYV